MLQDAVFLPSKYNSLVCQRFSGIVLSLFLKTSDCLFLPLLYTWSGEAQSGLWEDVRQMSHLAEERCGEDQSMAPAGISHGSHKKKSWKQARQRRGHLCDGRVGVTGRGRHRLCCMLRCYRSGAAATTSPAASHTEITAPEKTSPEKLHRPLSHLPVVRDYIAEASPGTHTSS